MEKIKFSEPYVFEEEAAAAAEVVSSKWLVGGSKLQEFERRFADLCDAPYAIGVSSWTAGAFLVLHAWGLGVEDEVIVPSYTFIASANVIRHVGATPVFADIDPETWNISPNGIECLITPKTRAIIGVDQLGLPCDIDTINNIAKKHGLLVLDDAACSFGSKSKGRPIGNLADVSIFSLHARKPITTGEGGMIVVSEKEFAERLRMLRHQGMSLNDFQRDELSPTTFEEYPEIGFNFRFTDIQAAVGLIQLDRLEDILIRRRRIAEGYNMALGNISEIQTPIEPNGIISNWQSYMIGLKQTAPIDRNDLMTRLYKLGVPTRRGVMATHLEMPYLSPSCHLPNTENAFERNLLLPMHPRLTDEQQAYIVRSIERCLV